VSSFIYNSFVSALVAGKIDFETDTFKVMLTDGSYDPDKDADDYRNDVVGEVVDASYTAGGETVVVTVTADLAEDKVTVTFAPVEWPAASFSARRAVYYKARGGAASADELIFVVDFDATVAAAGGEFTVQQSSIVLTNNQVGA